MNNLTPFGWGFITVIGISLWLTYKICNRMMTKQKSGCLLLGFIGLIMLSVNIMSYVISFNQIQNATSIFIGNKYQATIVDYKISEGTSSRGHSSYKKNYYTAIVRYKNENNDIITQTVNIGSDKIPIIGGTIIISVQSDKSSANNMSAAKSPIFLFFSLFQAIFISMSFLMSCYGLGVNNANNIKWTKRVFLITLIIGVALFVINLKITAGVN